MSSTVQSWTKKFVNCDGCSCCTVNFTIHLGLFRIKFGQPDHLSAPVPCVAGLLFNVKTSAINLVSKIH